MPKFSKSSGNWEESRKGMGYKKGRPSLPKEVRDKVIADYTAQENGFWRYNMAEIAERNDISAPTIYRFLRETNTPLRNKAVEKRAEMQKRPNGLKDLEWQLRDVVAYYNAEDRKGRRIYTVSDLAERFRVSSSTLTSALRLAQSRGYRVDWRGDTSTHSAK